MERGGKTDSPAAVLRRRPGACPADPGAIGMDGASGRAGKDGFLFRAGPVHSRDIRPAGRVYCPACRFCPGAAAARGAAARANFLFKPADGPCNGVRWRVCGEGAMPFCWRQPNRQALRRGLRWAFAARAYRFSVGDSQTGARACALQTNPASGPSFSAISSSAPCRLLRGGKQKRPRRKRRSRIRDAGQTYLDVEESGKVEARALIVG